MDPNVSLGIKVFCGMGDQAAVAELLQQEPHISLSKPQLDLLAEVFTALKKKENAGVADHLEVDQQSALKALKARIKERMSNPLAYELGYVIEDDFFFNADWHDAAEKRLLGRRIYSDGGLAEGEEALAVLVDHPSTAYHLSRKLAVRFVSDTPPEAFVERLAEVFMNTRGDMRALLWAIVKSDAFWSGGARRAKIKSPFELAVSGVRGLGAEVRRPGDVNRWIDQMGQPLYRYQAPTGFPDYAEAWVNAGALLHRMNFGMSLASGEVRGVRLNLKKLNGGREPESPVVALKVYASILLPERDVDETLRVLTPMLSDPAMSREIRERSESYERESASGNTMMEDDALEDPFDTDIEPEQAGEMKPEVPMTLAQVVGLILGSPEFQRR